MNQGLPQVDNALLNLVNIVNGADDGKDEETAISITLFVEGVVITGMLISYDRYAKLSNDFMGLELFPDPNPKNESDEEHDPRDDEDLTDATMIHLKDAKVVTGYDMVPSEGGMIFRCKLHEVSGFAYGELVTDPN